MLWILLRLEMKKLVADQKWRKELLAELHNHKREKRRSWTRLFNLWSDQTAPLRSTRVISTPDEPAFCFTAVETTCYEALSIWSTGPHPAIRPNRLAGHLNFWRQGSRWGQMFKMWYWSVGGVKSYAWPEKVFLFQIPGLDRGQSMEVHGKHR